MKRTFLFVLMVACFYYGRVQAQPSLTTMNVKYPQPPDVAPLLKFTETPVTYFNGSANISVPLYTITSGDLSFPITINYQSSGIKVDEEASLVGLGWSLSTVGTITETNPMAAVQNALAPAIVPDQSAVLPANVSDHVTNIVMSGEVFTDTNGVCHTLPPFSPNGPNGNEYEPDLFIMSANGHSCKFFVPNGMPRNNWVNVDNSNIRIVANQPQGGGLAGNFTAILPDGTQYLFNVPSYTENQSLGPFGSINYNYARTNYLSQIISPKGKTIRFVYLGSDHTTVSQQGFSETWANDNAGILQSGASITPSSVIYNKYLDTVYFDNGYAKYFYSDRDDIQGGFKLDSIDIFRQGQAVAVRTISFQYGYYNFPKNNWGDFITDGQMVGTSLLNGPPEQYRRERLKLLSVRINHDPPYTFYYDNNPLPYKTAFAQDLWGYFNGNTIKTLLPNYNELGYIDNGIPSTLLNWNTAFIFANRAAQFPFTKAGILEQVTYPTGGYTRFQYEPNTFSNPEGAAFVADTLVSAEDIGVGQKVVEFDVPSAGFQTNPAVINVQLICGGGNGTCTVAGGYSGGCEGYTNNDQPNGLYALLQMRDPSTGIWQVPSQNNIFDFSNAALTNTTGPCGAPGIAENLAPGHYRIVANYPDGKTDGNLGGPSAFISVDYKVLKTQVVPNQGGGLRIGSITDFSAGGQVAQQRQFHYSAGQMMTKPIFYRWMNGNRPGGNSEFCLPDPNTEWGIPMTIFCLPGGGDPNAPQPVNVNTDRIFLALYNNPMIPYSYSANGSPVGYDSVYETSVDGQGNDQGRTIYIYAARPDNYLFYGTNLPGTPSAADLNNGELLQQIVQKRVGNNYPTLRSTSYAYSISNERIYFGYRVEYMPNYRGDGTTEFTCQDPNSQFLHFYPIKTGHVNMMSKTVTDSASGIGLTVSTNYTYNALNQESSETLTKSNGKTLTHTTLYPGDYTATGDVTATMRGLNMLDYPIEKVISVNNLAVEGAYTQYLSHDNIVTPSATWSLAVAQPLTITPSAPGNTKDGHYEQRMTYSFDANGNQAAWQKTGGPATNYLYDYQHSLPVAEIANAQPGDYAYTSFEADGNGNWTYAGMPVADGTTPSGQSSYPLSAGALTSPSLNPAETYVLAYWTTNTSPYSIPGTIGGYPILVRSYNGWNYYLHKLTGQSGISITGSGSIDDLRLYPDRAQMRTSLYDPLVGITVQSDVNGKANYYEYDPDMRLKDIKDLEGNIVKEFQYGFVGFDQNFNYTAHPNKADTLWMYGKCGPGYTPIPAFAYIIPAGLFVSYISQEDADSQAVSFARMDMQPYADASGGCSPQACAAPMITGVTTNGTNFILTYTGMHGAATAWVQIVDLSGPGETQPNLDPTQSSGTLTGTVPVAGHQYSFMIRMFGPSCPGSLTSNQVNVQF